MAVERLCASDHDASARQCPALHGVTSHPPPDRQPGRVRAANTQLTVYR